MNSLNDNRDLILATFIANVEILDINLKTLEFNKKNYEANRQSDIDNKKIISLLTEILKEMRDKNAQK